MPPKLNESTIRADHSWRQDKPPNPAGLLQFFPLGTPAEMRFFVLRRGSTDIGRDETCAIQIDDGEISRRHAEIRKLGDGWQVSDCGSTNGVFVNGQRTMSRPLQGDEVVRIGTSLFRLLLSGAADGDCTIPVQGEGMIAGPGLHEAKEWFDRAAQSPLTVLLTGETGTGKDVAARYVHQKGQRSQGPYVPVNCAAIPAEIVESELFGHMRGAFSGASSDTRGLIRQAEGGTLFLDEVGELPLKTQAKLLRVLQDHCVRPVGGTRSIQVDVQVLCATNRDLPRRVEKGEFREDLYARIAYLEVQLPPLRQRLEDIPALVQHFMDKHGGGMTLSVEVAEFLCCQPWPQNIRQLEAAVQRAMLVATDEPQLTPAHFGLSKPDDTVASPSVNGPAPVSLDHPQALELDKVLRRHSGDVDLAAGALGLSRSQLYRRAKKFGISVPTYRR